MKMVVYFMSTSSTLFWTHYMSMFVHRCYFDVIIIVFVFLIISVTQNVLCQRKAMIKIAMIEKVGSLLFSYDASFYVHNLIRGRDCLKEPKINPLFRSIFV